jgi:hypothetical protein
MEEWTSYTVQLRVTRLSSDAMSPTSNEQRHDRENSEEREIHRAGHGVPAGDVFIDRKAANQQYDNQLGDEQQAKPDKSYCKAPGCDWRECEAPNHPPCCDDGYRQHDRRFDQLGCALPKARHYPYHSDRAEVRALWIAWGSPGSTKPAANTTPK